MMEHIHIISGGKSIGDTYKVILRSFAITETVIVLNASSEQNEDIGQSIQTVKKLSESLNIRCDRQISYASAGEEGMQEICEKIISLWKENKDRKFSINITGGTKLQAISLYQCAIWIGADIYYITKEQEIIAVSSSRLPAEDVLKNKNLLLILDIIDSKNGYCRRTELKQELTKHYEPIRSGRSEKRTLTEGILGDLILRLCNWKLIEEEYCDKSRKYKQYKITFSGKIIRKMYED